MGNNDFRFIQDQIAYNFKNLDLLQQAFVRRSYSKENGGEDNEVLEFIGDIVLDFIAVKYLAEKHGYFLSECDDFDRQEEFDEFASEYRENRLTEIKKRLVEKKELAHRIDMLGLAEYLEKNNLINFMKDEILNPDKAEAINQLEILARRGYFSVPTYHFCQEYDKDGNPVWGCECRIDEESRSFFAKASSKRDAKKSSAYKMLKYMLEKK